MKKLRRFGPAPGLLAVFFVIGCATGREPLIDGESGAGGTGDEGTGGADSVSNSSTGVGPGGGAASGSGGASTCTYPAAPFGVHVGDVVDGSFAWEGYAANNDIATGVSAADYFDCDGTKGINAVLILLSATWCGPCQLEAQTLPGKIAGGWSDAGIRVLTLMVQDGSENPATLATATQWRDAFGLEASAVAADPGFVFDHFDFDTHTNHTGFPTAIIIDPRTMKIILYQQGDTPVDATLEQLAAKNGG